MTVSSITDFDKKRKKISLDEGRLIFLLYKGELGRLRLQEGDELSEEALRKIYEDILKPRIKKRALYYLRSSDKTEWEVRRKLRESLYPDELIDYALEFLKGYGFVDDGRYAENFVEARRGRDSKREIMQKLRRKGIASEKIDSLSDELLAEDEEELCREKLLKYVRGRDLSDPKERARAYRYMLGKGFSYDTVNAAMQKIKENQTDQ